MTIHARFRILLPIGLCVVALNLQPAGRLPAMADDRPLPTPGAEGSSPEEQATPTPPPKAKPLVIPASEKKRTNPLPQVREAIEAGRLLFTTQCSMCHGENGKGKGDLAPRLSTTVPDLTDPRVQARRTDGEWFYILGRGHGDMPPETRLLDQQKWEMVLFMRTLEKAPPKGR